MIKKELKRAVFIYDEENKDILISEKDEQGQVPHTTVLPRLYMFSLMRFIIRVAQKRRPRKKNVQVPGQKRLFK